MNFERGGINSLLNLNFNPDILTEEETKECLSEAGINTASIEEKFALFEKKIEAWYMLELARQKRENFDKNYEALKNECLEPSCNESETNYRAAARNKTATTENDIKSDLLDIKMLEVLKNK
ncbi:MAG: hypothetical protein FD143_2244 [Ignavibacteria bacterium]|nr:MAG: hypothetical protein FD143_2244 [Ignavibacteria bacterium]KAF0158529.1 MAG: hypothetical protein FD188_2529 [Ignavibacteria bacterium]